MAEMTPQEAIKAIEFRDIHIEGDADRLLDFCKGIVVAKEALRKQIDSGESEATAMYVVKEKDAEADEFKSGYFSDEEIEAFSEQIGILFDVAMDTAIKEFAEQLKARAEGMFYEGLVCHIVDSVLKERAGAGNG